MKCPQQMDKLFLKWFFVIIDFHLSLGTLTEKFNIPKESVEDMFRKACDLLDLPNSITKVASMDECVRSVQSDGVSPLMSHQVRKIGIYCSALARHTVYWKYVITHWLAALILGYPFITF